MTIAFLVAAALYLVAVIICIPAERANDRTDSLVSELLAATSRWYVTWGPSYLVGPIFFLQFMPFFYALACGFIIGGLIAYAVVIRLEKRGF